MAETKKEETKVATTPETKPATALDMSGMSPEIKAMMERVLTQGMAMGIAMAKETLPEHRKANAQPAINTERCPDCQQYKVACKNEHQMAVVFPANPRWARHWQGVTINGITYISAHTQHSICIPKNANIVAQVRVWERQEEDAALGRSITMGSSQVIPASFVNGQAAEAMLH